MKNRHKKRKRIVVQLLDKETLQRFLKYSKDKEGNNKCAVDTKGIWQYLKYEDTPKYRRIVNNIIIVSMNTHFPEIKMNFK